MKESARRYSVVFFSALSVRILVWLFVASHPHTAFDNDSALYVSLGGDLFRHHVFSSLIRTPVYPLLIASVHYISGEVLPQVLLSQCVLDSVTAVVVASIFFRLFGDNKYSLMAGLIYAINPFAIYYSNMILTETLFTLLLAIMFYLVVCFFDRQRYVYLAISGVTLGLSALCRPIALYVPLFILAGLFFVKIPFKKRVASCILFILCFFVAVSPWYLRNYKYYHRWTLSPIDELNYFISFAPEVLMIENNPLSALQVKINEPIEYYRKLLWNQVKSKYGWRENSPSKVLEDAKRAALLGEEGKKVILERPLIFLASHLLNISRTLCPYYPSFSTLTGIDSMAFPVLSFIIDLLTIVFFIAGVFFSLKGEQSVSSNRVLIYTLMAMIFYFSFVPGVVGYARFRVPVLPYISILSAAGIKGVFRRMKLNMRPERSANQKLK
jgi:4-amino-4-deoxy-L-arabinose transferase-like glycosyltransferase